MFTVYFHNATTTPFQPGLSQLVRAALENCGAEATGLEAEWRLRDGSLFYLFGEDEDEGMLAEYPVLTEAVSTTIFGLLGYTRCFAVGLRGDQTLVRCTGGVGDPRGVLAQPVFIDEVDHAGLHALLDGLKPNTTQSSDVNPGPNPPTSPSRGRSSPIMDFLFGRAG